MFVIAYLFFGVLFELLHLKDIERAFIVKRIENPFEVALIMLLIIVGWPFLALPPRSDFWRHR